jgi:hypothetical protein
LHLGEEGFKELYKKGGEVSHKQKKEEIRHNKASTTS